MIQKNGELRTVNTISITRELLVEEINSKLMLPFSIFSDYEIKLGANATTKNHGYLKK